MLLVVRSKNTTTVRFRPHCHDLQAVTAEYIAAALLNILAHKKALAFSYAQGHDSTQPVSSALLGRHKGICTLLEQGSNLFGLRTGRHHTVRPSGHETAPTASTRQTRHPLCDLQHVNPGIYFDGVVSAIPAL